MMQLNASKAILGALKLGTKQSRGPPALCFSLTSQNVSTWTPFAAAFNSKPQRKLNLKFNRENKGLFGIPQLKDHSGFYLLKTRVEHEVDRLVEEATSPHRKRKMVVVFDELSDSLCKVADMADFVRMSHPNRDFAGAAEETCVELSSLVEKLNTNASLHKALKRVLENGDVVETNEVDRRVTELFMFDFEQSGIHLDEEKRKQFVKLNEQIHMLGSFFQRGTQKPVAIPKTNLPENLRHVFGVDGDNITVTGLFSDHYSSLVREAAYRIFLHPDNHQAEILEALLSARHQLAHLVNFPTFSHRANRGTMMENPENITEFLNKLSEKLKPSVQKELASMLQLKTDQEGRADGIMPWDPAYLTAIARQQRNDLTAVETMAYFSLGAVMEGLNQLFQSLFGVSLHHVEMEYGEGWSPDIYKLAVVHQTEGVLGYIYCDFFDRPGKPGQLKVNKMRECCGLPKFVVRSTELRLHCGPLRPSGVTLCSLYFAQSCKTCMASCFPYPHSQMSVSPIINALNTYCQRRLCVQRSLKMDCHYTIQGGCRQADGSYQHPVVVLQLSLPGPRSSSTPTLLTAGNVDNLFHEFGHAMHSMLGRTHYQHVTGTRCTTDFAEVPSVLMEFFAAEPKVISSFARHHKTGAPMEVSDVQNLCESKKMYAASDMQQQVFFSMLDQVYHGTHPLSGTTSDLLATSQEQYYSVPYVPKTAWQLRFNHLVGYGARYYSYLVSRAVASQVWHSCFKNDPFDRLMGTKYREDMLAHGGEKHPSKIVADMLGKPPTVDNLVESLLMDLEGVNR